MAGSADITEYVIQWDTNDTFSRSASGSCSTVGFGQCTISGAALSAIPPYRYLIQLLTLNHQYFVRVAAKNSVSQLSPTIKWSGAVSAVTANQPPSAPVAVVADGSGLTFVQVLITPPVSSGGVPISHYLIEWDSSSGFDSTSYGSITVINNQTYLPALKRVNGDLVYEIPGLKVGQSYWVRVSAQNSVGFGPSTTCLLSATTGGKPNAPASVTLKVASVQNTPITKVNVSWTSPVGSNADGGSPVIGYLVEWW